MKKINLEELYNICNIFDLSCEMNELSIAIQNLTNNFNHKWQNNQQDAKEIYSFLSFVKELYKNNTIESDFLFNDYYFSYTIPQISKEFDLLRLSEHSIVNIELKSNSSKQKIKSQLHQNYHYLKFLNLYAYNMFAYTSGDNKLYKYDIINNTLIEYQFSDLIEILNSTYEKNTTDISSLFVPKKYLASPINRENQSFIKGAYFLSNEQNKHKNRLIKYIEDKENIYNIFSITGAAGTGKTLLTYDIAKYFINKACKVLIIQAGNLRPGHYNLKKIRGWNILSAKDSKSADLSQYEYIFADESQRFNSNTINNIIDKAPKAKIILSYDMYQSMDNLLSLDNFKNIISTVPASNSVRLSNKIRSNPEISNFIIKLFNIENNTIKNTSKTETYDNIDFKFFKDYKECSSFLLNLCNNDSITIINYTPTIFENIMQDYEKMICNYSTHASVGLEFDHVVAVIPDFFEIQNDNLVAGRGTRYDYDYLKMFYQAISRSISKLTIIIVKDKEIYNYCNNILHKLKFNIN